MSAYNVNTAWDDPFERAVERRRAVRFPFRMKVSIRVRDDLRDGFFTGPGVVENISLTGVQLYTKHVLAPRQEVMLAIPTSMCPASMCLPNSFLGPARVVRIGTSFEGYASVAMAFGQPFSERMDFALFIEFMQQVSHVL